MVDASPKEAEDSAANQFGLQDLAQLPLLEQVHRLFHAIQMQYPYKETPAWKNLPLEQKQRMLAYIRDKRARKTAPGKQSALPKPTITVVSGDQSAHADDAGESPAAAAGTAAQSAGDPPKPAVKTDLYLQMLQRRTVVAPATGEQGTHVATHPNSAYIAPAQVAQYAERKSRAARWKVVDAEFYDEKCTACGVVHREFDGAKGAILSTIAAMMSTFGDFGRSCALAAQEVKRLVGEHLRAALAQLDPEELSSGPGLRALVEAFHEEATYYGRWREFRGESKHEQNELEDVEEEELAEELDLFAVAEADSVFNAAFLERIKFADERTKTMDWSNYDAFARGRKLNFMSSKGQQFRHWLRIGKSSRASLEFMNFVAYHNIGRLVELAIKRRTGGVLQTLGAPLNKSDIQAVATEFSSAAQRPPTPQRSSADHESESSMPVAKVRRVSTRVGEVTVTERVPVPAPTTADAASSPENLPPPPETTTTSSSAISGATTPPDSDSKARPTRLKRLR